MSTFGNLQQVDLRKEWEHYAFNFEDQDQWPKYFAWLKDKAEKFKQVFGA